MPEYPALYTFVLGAGIALELAILSGIWEIFISSAQLSRPSNFMEELNMLVPYCYSSLP
jgi:hypothetical protein